MDGSNDGNIQGLLLGYLLGCNDCKIFGFDGGIIIISTGGIGFGPLLGDVDGSTVGMDVVTEMGSSDMSFDGFNHGKV